MTDQPQANFAEMSPRSGLIYLSMCEPELDEQGQSWREYWLHELGREIHFTERSLLEMKDLHARFDKVNA